jgi:ATP-binding cassette subfamily B protein
MENIVFIVGHVKKYIWWLSGAIAATLALVGVQLVAPWVIRELINTVTSSAQGEADLGRITQLTILILGVYFFRAVFRFMNSYLSHKAGWGVVADVRHKIYIHLQRQSLRFYEDSQTGELMSRLVNDTDKLEHLISHALPDTLVNVLTLIGVSAVLFSMNGSLMLLTLIPIPFVILAVRLFAKYTRPAFHERQQDLANLNANLQDNLSGIREIQAFNQEHNESSNIWGKIVKFRDSNLKALRLMATFSPLIEFTSSLGTIMVIYIGGRLSFNGTLSVADLVAFFLYLEMFYQPIRALTQAWEHTQEAVVGAERVRYLLNQEPEIQDTVKSVSLKSRAQGELSFNNVSFHYQQGADVLKNINLTIPAKTMTALVGPTGVGKTTMAGLIPRFYDTVEGSLLLDGKDTKTLKIEDLRKNISMVLQDVFLFNGTLEDNIRFGKPQASNEEVIAAAKSANAHEFIMSFPEGYDTRIGERGIKLSGGQKQRISIARALLKDAPVLILDEATSSVDTETEQLIQDALAKLMQGRTTIVIAHRLSTIQKADQIVVLEEGRIKESGTHEELLNLQGLYHKLTNIQNVV